MHFHGATRLLALLFLSLPALPQASWFDHLEYRAIGPAIMGGRTTDVEGVPGNPNIVYVATGAGGLWKTTNGGVTWSPIFERQNTFSIGDIALEPGNPSVIWVGTGESNVRNSVSFGDGVYKSTDGGKTWKHLGLAETERISRMLVHPTNPDIAFAGALGHAFGPNESRGVYRTADGGKTWQKTLYLDAQHGVSDMDMDPGNPNLLYAALWKFERKPWTHTSGSEQGGVWKSADGGLTWKKLGGLPKLIGRIGVKVAPSKPNVVYVICESKEGTLYRSDDYGENFVQVSKNRDIVQRGFYYADMRVDPTDENRVYALASNMHLSIDGGKTFKIISRKTHLDFHTLWIDPKDPNRMWQGQDGGIAVSYDRGENWETVNNIPLGQFYQIHVDNRLPFYDVMGGLQDNGSWVGPSRTREPAGVINDDWRMTSFGDGFFVVNHPDDPDLYLTESQGGSLVRSDMRTRETQTASPQPKSNAGGPADGMKYRFNWNTPVVPSPHDNNTVYFGANVLFRTQDFGKTWKALGGDLTKNERDKQKDAGGPIWFDNSTAENYGTIITVSESPVRPGTVWAGTDDGNLQVTVNGGESWTNVIANISGLPPTPVVTHVEASRTSATVAYASFDRHMFDDFRPYVFKTSDAGKTWQPIVTGLPDKAYVHVVKEDPKNPRLLYVGTELGFFASWDGGATFSRLGLKNLPHVPVHDVVVHPRDNDLVLATHGRSVYIFDDATAIQKMSPAIAATAAHLFEPRRGMRVRSRFIRYGVGNKMFAGPNPPAGALLTYWLKDKLDAKTPLKLEILDASGKVIRSLRNPSKESGVNRVNWDLRGEGPFARRERGVPGAGAGDDEEEGFQPGPRGPQMLPGKYTARLTAGQTVSEQPVEVIVDPSVKVTAAELATQQDYLGRIQAMQSDVNRVLKTVDSVRDQLDQIEKAAKANGVTAPKELADYKTAVKDLEGKLAKPSDQPRLEGGPHLIERLGQLFNGIDSSTAAPTVYQIEVFGELKAEYDAAMPAARAWVSTTAPQWNDGLRKLNLSGLVLPKP